MKINAESWEAISTDSDKQILCSFINDKLKQFSSISKAVCEPNAVVQHLLTSTFQATGAGRKYLERNPDSTESDLPDQKIWCTMDHATAVVLKAHPMGSPSQFLSAADSFSKEQIEDRMHVWEWKAIIGADKDSDLFDIFAYLVERSP